MIHRVAAAFFFFNNYVDVRSWGSFTLSLCWSNAVDFQCSIVLFLLIRIFKSASASGGDDVSACMHLASRLRILFVLAFFASIGICGMLFELESLNIFLLGQHSHFGLLQVRRILPPSSSLAQLTRLATLRKID